MITSIPTSPTSTPGLVWPRWSHRSPGRRLTEGRPVLSAVAGASTPGGAGDEAAFSHTCVSCAGRRVRSRPAGAGVQRKYPAVRPGPMGLWLRTLACLEPLPLGGIFDCLDIADGRKPDGVESGEVRDDGIAAGTLRLHGPATADGRCAADRAQRRRPPGARLCATGDGRLRGQGRPLAYRATIARHGGPTSSAAACRGQAPPEGST